MGESVVSSSADGPSLEIEGLDPSPPPPVEQGRSRLVSVAPKGDIVLDVTFETSAETIRKSRKNALAAARKAGGSVQPQDFKPTVKVAYRVSLEALKNRSKYFTNLLSNVQFSEAKLVADGHNSLKQLGISPADANAEDLPWVAIKDDDEATRTAGREHVFEDMLCIIHQVSPKVTRATMSYVTTLTITADRFDTVAAISQCLNNELKFKWPITSNRPLRDESGRPTDVEQILRQKILVSWLLGQPMRLHQSSKELIVRGSSHWSTFHDSDADMSAAWWSLPDGLERKSKNLPSRRDLLFRRKKTTSVS